MNENISVIVPYYNEADTISTTLDLLSRQTFRPKEVILVDSGSTDETYEKIQVWTENGGQSPDDVPFTNLRANTGVPSSSKNEGIRVSKSDLVAFMDCGLLFGTDWLEKQVDFLNSQNLDVVSGGCYLRGVGLWDCSAVAQTYGYKRFRPTVPSSLVRKSVFDRTGLFLEGRRSGYDVDWVNRLRTLGIKRGINRDVVVQYNGVNYAKSLRSLLPKSIRYGEGTLGLHRYYYPYAYFLLVPIFLLAVFLKPAVAAIFVPAYLIGRGYLMPAFKSRGLRIITDYPLSVLTLPLTGFVIDVGKMVGFLKGVAKGQLFSKKSLYLRNTT
jgi:glycosyltransferase involved in cell wall biosynthesis